MIGVPNDLDQFERLVRASRPMCSTPNGFGRNAGHGDSGGS